MTLLASTAVLTNGSDPLVVSTLVLLLTYGAIIWDKLNRAIVALLGACLMVGIGVLDQAEALRGVDWNSLGLLTGMMILVSISRRCGMFEAMAIWAAQRAQAHPTGILILLQITTAVLSALLDNVTTVLLIVPVTLAVTKALDVDPYPFLFAEIFASNIGGTTTLIGDPPNILIGSTVGLEFNAFIRHLTPVIVIVMLVQTIMVFLVWGRDMRFNPARATTIMAMDARGAISDWILLGQSLAILAMVILGFIFSRQLQLQPATIAMTGAALLMCLDNWQHHGELQAQNVHKTFADIEWITIFFFLGLFIVVHGVEQGGALHLLADTLVRLTGGQIEFAGYAILWASAFISAIVDNIPFVATMIPLIKAMAPAYGGPQAIEPLWWCLALGACLGGNGTLIGASANLTVAGIADRNGIEFSFIKYTMYAFPMMIVSVAICQLYVWLRYFN